jgi:hypothetical protein
MYKFLLSTAALAAVASAIAPIRIGNFTFELPGNHTIPAKSAAQSGCFLPKAAQDGGVICSNSVNGLHYLCNGYSYQDAAVACTDNGWRLALIDDNNKGDLVNLLGQCSLNPFVPAWIASFNGLQGEECSLAIPIGAAVNGFPEGVCGIPLPVVCQDIPIETVTEPVPVDTVTISAVYTTTVAVLPTCPGQRIKPCQRHSANSDFVLIDTNLPFVQAECACNQLGLKLADLNITNFLDASSELWQALGARKHAWIRSWNGDVYEEEDCLALWTGSTGPNGAIAVPQSCEQRKPVLCQKKPRRHCPCKPEAHDCHCHHHHHHRHHEHVFLEKDGGDEQDDKFEVEKIEHTDEKCIGHGECPKLCPFRVSNIRVVKAAVGAYEAEEVCQKFGWSLLDLTKHNQRRVAALQRKCGSHHHGRSMWIRSFEQVDGAACMLASPLYEGSEDKSLVEAKSWSLPSVAGYIFTADTCAAIGDLYVLCDKECEPVETITGTYEGTITTTTTTSGFTITEEIYTATVTTTVTLLQ